MSGAAATAVSTARQYYNSTDADSFYHEIWGGEDIHVGLYTGSDDEIRTASERTVAAMAESLGERLRPDARVIDLGAGYGGAARWLADKKGCRVTCVNLSEVQNDRNRAINVAKGCSDRVVVLDGSFEAIPSGDGEFDVVWSQDSILHSGDRPLVFREIDRVLKPGGEVIFTDPMQADTCPPGVLGPVLDRIHLSSLGSIAYYRGLARDLGWEEVRVQDLTEQLVLHYTHVRRSLRRRRDELADKVSAAYVDRMLVGLEHWITAGSRHYLAWGILHFRKP
jgi:sarcosine/dimethylglycine N-methyltransferase